MTPECWWHRQTPTVEGSLPPAPPPRTPRAAPPPGAGPRRRRGRKAPGTGCTKRGRKPRLPLSASVFLVGPALTVSTARRERAAGSSHRHKGTAESVWVDAGRQGSAHKALLYPLS